LSSFILRRLLLAIPTLFGVLVVAFLLLYVAPGDPVQSMIGERADSATITRLRAQLHLDDPLPVRFGHYVGSVVRGDLGRSYITNRPITQDIRERFPKTMQLAGAAMLLASFLGISLGILSARNPGGFADRFALGLAYLGISFPVYWVGLLLILLFAVTLHWLPPSGYGGLRFLILPALTLGMRSIAFLARMTRSAMLEALNADFVRTARAKGLTEWTVTVRHALRNAMIPVITLVGLQAPLLIGGAVIIETIFVIPGMGLLLLDGVNQRDYPIITGVFLVVGVAITLINLLIDLSYGVLDPKVRYR